MKGGLGLVRAGKSSRTNICEILAKLIHGELGAGVGKRELEYLEKLRSLFVPLKARGH